MKITIKKQLITSFLAVGIVPFVVISMMLISNTQDTMMQKSYDMLTSARDSKVSQIERFIEKLQDDIEILAQSPDVVSLVDDSIKVHKILKVKANEPFPSDHKLVNEIDEKYSKSYQEYMKAYGYSDILVVYIKHGHIMFNASQKLDYDTNVNGVLKELWEKVIKTKKTVYTDMKSHKQNNNLPTMFIGTPVYSKGKIKSILVFQVNNKAINSIMNLNKGYGKSQEDYLVGSDKLMRSDSLLNPTTHSINASFENPTVGLVDTTATQDGLNGKSNTQIIQDYRGSTVLSAYSSFPIGDDIRWVLISEIDQEEVDKPVNDLIYSSLIIGLIFIIIILIVAFVLANYISKPITKAVQNITSGNDQIISASQEISGSATLLAESSSSQAASVEEISATIEETSATIEQTANNSREADILSSDASSSAQEGYEKVKTLLVSMNEITSSSKEIANIIKTIDEIAFQTNLLALNAAVEAARAGEHGLGFAVVADEVRNLAGKSANAAKETATIIEHSLSQVNNGNKIANDTHKAFEEIMDKIKKSSNLVSEISLASKEQTEGMKQINHAMNQIDNVTQTVASTSEESAAASEELNAQAVSMGDTISSIGAMVGYKG